MGAFGDFRIDRIVTLARRGRYDLNVDAHSIEIDQAAVDRGHDLPNVVLLLRIDFLAGSIRKISERRSAGIDMGSRQLGGFGNHDVGVNIDRDR
jgi:hypothetical protein